MQDIVFIDGDHNLLDNIGPLWEKLNEYHKNNTKHFSQRYSDFTFEKRKAGLLEKVKSGSVMRIDLAKDVNKGVIIGYCINTVSPEKVGEIESIYIDKDYRGKGIGDNLIRKALQWMDSLGINKKIVGVAAGNEQAFSFYERYEFYPCLIILEQKNDRQLPLD